MFPVFYSGHKKRVLMWILGLFLFLNVIHFARFRQYKNPILPYNSSVLPIFSIVKNNGVYYATIGLANGEMEVELFESDDLQNWSAKGLILKKPQGTSGLFITDPRLFVSKKKEIRIFFARYHTSYHNQPVKEKIGFSFGLAHSSKMDGPFYPHLWPMTERFDTEMSFPFAFEDETSQKTFIFFTSNFERQISVSELSSDLYSVKNQEPKTLLKISLSWEQEYFYSPFVFRRGKYYYLLYMGGANCKDYKVGIARSNGPEGPFEKKLSGLNFPEEVEGALAYPSLVQDHDGRDVLIYMYSRKNNCASQGIFATPIQWVDDWPLPA